MSPGRIERQGGGPFEYVYSQDERLFRLRGVVEHDPVSGREISVDVEALKSIRDGFFVVYEMGSAVGRREFLAGSLAPERRPRLIFPDGRKVVPVKDEELPDKISHMPW